MDKKDLERLVEKSKEPFICENTNCSKYRTIPICETHAHGKCEDYIEMRIERLMINAIRNYNGWEMYE